jgi:broad specificity phosphatase PhoE
MSDWHWVRHGPTHARGMVGWLDLPADLGDAAALARLRAALPGAGVVVSSDLCRATATADALALPQRRLAPARDLRELHFGTWEGRVWDEVAAGAPELSRLFWDRPGDIRAPGGESWNALRARVDACVDRIAAAHPGPVVAVAHFGVILTQVQRALGLDATAVLRHHIAPLSLTRLCHDGSRWRAGEINLCF